MSYKMSPSAWGNVFPVPSQIVDKHIRVASKDQLKVILWLLRHAGEEPSIEQLCEALKYDPSDAEDYLQYWVNTGIIINDGESHSPPAPPVVISSKSTAPAREPAPAPKAKEQPEEIKKKELPPLPEAKPTSEQIAVRASESDEIRFLFGEAQMKLGRTIGYDGQCTLLMMHDRYGLPVEVILMILEYCVSIGKTNMDYIGRLGKDWGEREIDTIDKADEQIHALREYFSLWTRFSQMAGISNPRPTAKQSEFLRCWSGDWGFDEEMIYIAYEEMANHTTKLSFPYINKILKNWHEAGIKKPDEIERGRKKPLQSKGNEAGQKGGKKREASYDKEEFKRRSVQVPAEYKKSGS